MEAFWKSRGVFLTFCLLYAHRGCRKLISCVKIQDDRRSKVKPIYKENHCLCLENAAFI